MNTDIKTWRKDWALNENPKREKEISIYLITLFTDFLNDFKIEEKSKSTKSRYYGHLHFLGRSIIKEAVYDNEDQSITPHELLMEGLGPDDGPLLYWNDERSQREVDAVCKKLYKFIKKSNH